jgi:hypothetical protein
VKNSEDARKLLKKTAENGLNSQGCLNRFVRQTPPSPLSNAHRRHGAHTGHVRHICLASSI